MRLNNASLVLVSYMVLAILLAGSVSAWPWLGLLTVIVVRGCLLSHLQPVPVPVQPLQGPHFLRRRQRSGELQQAGS